MLPPATVFSRTHRWSPHRSTTGWWSLRLKNLRLGRQHGFTLAELAIGFLIIGLLLAGAFMPMSSQIEVRNFADTRRTMDQVKEALIGFAQSNGRLPCPARGATPSGQTDAEVRVPPAFFAAGAEQYDATNHNCYVAFGVVPWTTLGVPETDSWGRRMTYRVAPAFADGYLMADNVTTKRTWQSLLAPVGGSQDWTGPTLPSPGNQSPACPPPPATQSDAPTPTPTQSSFALCSLGDIAVFNRSDIGHGVTPVGTALPAVIISHGKNGKGAWQSNGTALTAASANTDELANSTGTTTATPPSPNNYAQYVFYSRVYSAGATGCDDTSGDVFCEFDDIVVMISPSTLVARMVSALRLP